MASSFKLSLRILFHFLPNQTDNAKYNKTKIPSLFFLSINKEGEL